MVPAENDRPESEPANKMYRARYDTLYDEEGSGLSVVLSHGTLMDRTMFAPQLNDLSDEYRVIAYDSRARTDQWKGGYDLNDLVEDTRVFVDALSVDSFVLGGMSMGGFMAMRFAVRYPDILKGLILIDSMAVPHEEHEIEQYGQMIDRVKDSEIPGNLADTTSHILFGQTTINQNPELVESWKERWLTYPGDAVYNEVSSWLKRDDFTDRLEDIGVPVLIVHGEEDVAIEPSRAELMLDELPDARMVEVPEAGHSSNLENPEFVNREIRVFLEELKD